MTDPRPAQPIVLFGGFMSFAMLYWDMRDALECGAGQPVWIVQTLGHDWLPGVVPMGWIHLLNKLDNTVQQAASESDTGKVTLIGHSAGGVLARLYLSPRPFFGRAYRGIKYVSHLITLGSPHHNQGGLTRGGIMSRWVQDRYPGAYFGQVEYTSVAGRLIRGEPEGSLQARWVYKNYQEMGGDGHAWGDGLIPIQAALLHGSRQITLEGVSHFSGFGGPWYGSQEVIPLWWKMRGDHEPANQPEAHSSS